MRVHKAVMSLTSEPQIARLLITCPDRPGIVAKVADFLSRHGANISDLDQHSTDPEKGIFFMRVAFQTQHLTVSWEVLREQFQTTVAPFLSMDWQMREASHIQKVGVFVSKYDHVLLEILWRWSRNHLPMHIPFVISNHPDLASIVAPFKIPFYHIPFSPQTRAQAEKEMLALCVDHVDVIVLARYMQIVSPAFIQHFQNKIINIHHSFLPAFEGAHPYQQAYDKGVKLIGATAHYVTDLLDRGPIIAQDVMGVTHRLSVAGLREVGQDIEKRVLIRAVKAHLEDRIIVHENKTIVFEPY